MLGFSKTNAASLLGRGESMSVLRLSEYPSWDTAVSADEAAGLSDTESYDDVTSQGEELINYLMTTVNSTAFYEGVGVFGGETVDLSKCGEIETGTIHWTEDKPAGTSVVVEVAVSTDNGTTWGDWTTIPNGASLPGFSKGLDVTDYRVRYRVKLSTTNLTVAPSVSQIKISIISRKLFRIYPTGQVKVKGEIIENVREDL